MFRKRLQLLFLIWGALLFTLLSVDPLLGTLIWQAATLLGVFLIWLLFASSLLPGKTPLITRYAWLIDGPLDAREWLYTHRVTWVWAGLLSWVLVSKVRDTFFFIRTERPVSSDSFHDLLYLAAIISLLIGEFLLRKRLFQRHRNSKLSVFLRKLVQIPVRALIDFRRPPPPSA